MAGLYKVLPLNITEMRIPQEKAKGRNGYEE